jgi:hypothetical protein
MGMCYLKVRWSALGCAYADLADPWRVRHRRLADCVERQAVTRRVDGMP